MAVLYAPESEYAKEARKFEMFPTQYGAPGRPFVHKDYPAAMYKVTERNPIALEFQVADDENMRRNLESRGFVAGGPAAALAAYDQAQLALARAAAERAYDDRHLSAEAQAEAAAVDAETDQHVAEIPEKPIRRRPGRPPKAA